MKELKDLAESLNTPTCKLGIGSPLEIFNRGWNEGQQQAAKQLYKAIEKRENNVDSFISLLPGPD